MPAVPEPWTLRDYAFIADGERGALIGPRGEYVWMCAPRWDSDAVFGTLIGGGGSYTVSPTDPFVWGGYYESGSLIWRSRWVTTSGIIECREALAFPGRADTVVVLRRIEAIRGDARLHVRLQPTAEFGRLHMRDIRRDDARGCWSANVGPLRMRWSGAAEAQIAGDTAAERSLEATVVLSEGESADLVFELSDRELPDRPLVAPQVWSDTEKAWAAAIPSLGPTAAPRDAVHSYAVMRGLTTSSGAMVAAATMSLPERADEGANYDYRYAWIRDQCYAGIAVAADGPHELVGTAVHFVSERLLADGPNLRPAYTGAGDTVPKQRRLDLVGYPGGYDLAGNHVRDQFQLDVFGEALLLFAAAARHDMLTTDSRRAIDVAVDAIDANIDRPDAGIWELDERRWTHSRLSCAAGLRAVAAAGIDRDSGRLSTLADHIVADTSSRCLHPTGRWQRAADDERVDASLLLPALRGALPGRDPRSVATYRAVQRDLSRDHYVYRYPPRRGLGTSDSAFLLCGFLMALAAQQQGHTVEAYRYFERNRSGCGTPGLFSEEYDIRQRQLRGNIPQAFVHALMFEASSTLARSTPDDMKGMRDGWIDER
ncbi:glycoside hydrolase family 15 protein [Mycolicibacterium aichiense]|uniref:Glycoside hydrolase n=1 Tax=Mycolicibacterium aichiense TaxID=1799 RepID=A0AAD1MDE3_9MYCO|nr:glycoside hydrolase family 15 protein [Mycolicibacterium aichiense]MCV7019467.1 glycoside hydrolase family 15 protein [Mycolicibacterium aichiense]BBX08224.1 glycoside hydrolase [Mycolicibacterium aichiense]STZ82028.1 glycosyl hydrolase, family protein 15 [Mycolicibacterium aichiense]